MILGLAIKKIEEFKEGAYLGLAIGLVVIVYALVRKYKKRA